MAGLTTSLQSVLVLVLLILGATSYVLPSFTELGDVTLLYNNDLNLFNATQHRSVLLLTPKLQSAAESACSSLGEALLPINQTFFSEDLPSSLKYQEYLGNYPSGQKFWVASNDRVCQTVDSSGRISSASCLQILPALCTQSSPYKGSAGTSNLISVKTQGLNVTGFRDQLSFRFLGIPYANKPERFTYPTSYNGPSDIDATNYGSICVQSGSPSSSEDCLFLNVFTPYIPQSELLVQTSKLKAVIIFIHGGAFTSGSGSDPTVDGGNMASRGDIVFVTINYRLSTLGFLALNDGRTNGNFGIADQIAAIDWVRAHIKAFGGDPNRITIAGQSAGAGSVRALMSSPKAIGKFSGAIPQSNLAGFDYASTYSLYYTIEQEVSVAANGILSATGCANVTDQLSCLRAYNAQDLVSLSDVARYVVVDGTYITTSELVLNGTKKIANVHLMAGNMRDDGAAFIGFPSTGESFSNFLSSQGLPTSIINNSLYPVPPASDESHSLFNVSARAATEGEFRCLGQASVYAAVKHNLFQSVWQYEFNRSYQTPGYDPNAPACDAPVDSTHPYGNPSLEYYKCHSGELFFVYGNLPSNLHFRDENDLPFMQQSLDTWASFARTFNPNPDHTFLEVRGYTETAEAFAKLQKWEPITLKNINAAPLRELQVPSINIPFKDLEQCEFLGYPLTYFA